MNDDWSDEEIDWADEETDNPLRADDRNFYEVEKCGIMAQTPQAY
jgi:hypothetical protein